MNKINVICRFLFISLVSYLLISCEAEKNQRVYTSLIINNYHRWYGNSSWKDNFIFNIYENQADFDGYFSSPMKLNPYLFDHSNLPSSLLDSTLENNKNLYCETYRFDKFPPGTYYLKSFNAYNHEKFVEFNDLSRIDVTNPLDSIEIVNIITERYYIKSFELNKIEIHLDESIITKSDKLRVAFDKSYPPGYAGPPGIIFFDDSVRVSDFPVIKSNLSISINEFNSWWFDPSYFIEIMGVGIYKQYNVKLFELLNLNQRFSDSLIYFDADKHIQYKIYGKWILNN